MSKCLLNGPHQISRRSNKKLQKQRSAGNKFIGLAFVAIDAFSLPGTPRVVQKKCSIMSKVGASNQQLASIRTRHAQVNEVEAREPGLVRTSAVMYFHYACSLASFYRVLCAEKVN